MAGSKPVLRCPQAALEPAAGFAGRLKPVGLFPAFFPLVAVYFRVV